ncbi:B12-binding domain-containing radical SAM protein [Candidatus Omnitrophota bacterium]
MKKREEFKVLFVLANGYMDTLIPPSLSLLSAYLKKEGFQVKLFDTVFYKTKEKSGDEARYETLQVKSADVSIYGVKSEGTDLYADFRKMVLEYKPDLIALSAIEATYNLGISLLNSIKDINIKKIVGGIYATINPNEAISEECVDIVCVGEGDNALTELCRRLWQGEDYSDIKNLWIKKGDGSLVTNDMASPVNVNEMPFQDWSIFNRKRLFKSMGGKINITGCIELNRGCPYLCTYCCNDKLRELYKGKFYRERDVGNFIEEVLEKKKKYNLGYVYIAAESFLSTKKERFDEFIRLYKRTGIPFWVQSRPEAIEEDKIRRLESVGCEGLSVGIEHGNEEYRRKVLHRRMTDDVIVKAFKILNKFKGIRNCANSIIGFPDETRDQIFETIELAKRTQARNVMVHIFNPYKGTKLYDLCLEKNYLRNNNLSGDYRMDVIIDNPNISSDELKGLQRTFVLYVKFPETRYEEIERAERFDKEGNELFQKLSTEFKKTYL